MHRFKVEWISVVWSHFRAVVGLMDRELDSAAEDQTFTLSSDTWTNRPSHWTLSWGSDALHWAQNMNKPSFNWTLSWGSDAFTWAQTHEQTVLHTGLWAEDQTFTWAQTHEQTVLHTGLWAEDQMRLHWAQTHEQTVLHTGLWAEDQMRLHMRAELRHMNKPSFTLDSELRIRCVYTEAELRHMNRPSFTWTLSWGSDAFTLSSDTWTDRPSHWTLSWGSDAFTLSSDTWTNTWTKDQTFTLSSEHEQTVLHTGLWAEDQMRLHWSWARHMNRPSFTLDSELRIRCVYTELRHMNKPSFTLDSGLRIRWLHWAQTPWTDRPSHWTLSWGSDAFTLSSDTWTDRPSHWTLSWGSDTFTLSSDTWTDRPSHWTWAEDQTFTLSSDTWTDRPSHWTLSWGSDVYTEAELRHMNRPSFTLDTELRIRCVYTEAELRHMNRPSFTLDSELRIRRLHWAQTHEQTVLHTGLWAEDHAFTLKLSSDTWTDRPSHWTLSWGSDVYTELRHMNRPSFTLDSELRIRRLHWAQTHEQTVLHTGLWVRIRRLHWSWAQTHEQTVLHTGLWAEDQMRSSSQHIFLVNSINFNKKFTVRGQKDSLCLVF